MNIHKVPAARVYVPEDDIKVLQGLFGDILRSGQLTLGKHTSSFEDSFATYLGVRHAIAVNSGTSALEIILRGLGLLDVEVIIPTNTFAATAFAVLHSGNRVHLADIGPDLCLSLDSIEACVTSRTKAVMLVHIGGSVARDTSRIAKFCEERGLVLIEDAAHAHGSTLNGQFAGTFGYASAFSFYPTKVMTSGEGGMIVTSSDELTNAAKILRDQGKAGFTQNLHVAIGSNWRLSELHAVLGLAQLRRLNEFIAARRRIAQMYDVQLRGLPWLRSLLPEQGTLSNYYKYIAVLEEGIERSRLKTKLREDLGVAFAGEVYDVPLHRQPIFEKMGIGAGVSFSVADDLCTRHVCLPMSAVMTEAEVNQVVESLRLVDPW